MTASFRSICLQLLVVAALSGNLVQASTTCAQCSLDAVTCHGSCQSSDYDCPSRCSSQAVICKSINNCFDESTEAAAATSTMLNSNRGVEDAAMEEFLQACNSAVSVVASKSGVDEFLTQPEVQVSIEAWATSICPESQVVDGALSLSEYYDEASFQSFFDTLSCMMCLGVLDPFNAQAIDGDFESCGCTNGDAANPGPPIHIPSQTEVENNVYCALIHRLVFVQCQQPELTCHQSCEAQLNECGSSEACQNFEGPEGLIQCISHCDQDYFPCIEECDKSVEPLPPLEELEEEEESETEPLPPVEELEEEEASEPDPLPPVEELEEEEASETKPMDDAPPMPATPWEKDEEAANGADSTNDSPPLLPTTEEAEAEDNEAEGEDEQESETDATSSGPPPLLPTSEQEDSEVTSSEAFVEEEGDSLTPVSSITDEASGAESKFGSWWSLSLVLAGLVLV